MKQPEGSVDPAKSQHVCRLKKALYGLKQAPRAWFDRLRSTLLTWGFVNSKSDISLFVYKRQNVILILLVYMDDMLIIGNSSQLIAKID